ncbi:hypothetical protein AQUCO_00201321v1 [Aquilegia coerulea]|uniref:Uncharacterized protein n=1 Tax=Aquilegia coerulea TaxID=218851 RepID=A0A2G5F7B9_AQUCA|nr:hypothetical protein AQUCO_00201321v1 [Aquilegia coerulea]
MEGNIPQQKKKQNGIMNSNVISAGVHLKLSSSLNQQTTSTLEKNLNGCSVVKVQYGKEAPLYICYLHYEVFISAYCLY